MPPKRIPFPVGIEGEENLPHTRRSLHNCFNNLKGHLIGRPGITELADTGLVARGQFEWNFSLYQVVSQTLIKITDTTTGTFSSIGTIDGNTVIETAIGFNTAVIVVKGGNIYTLDKSDVLVDISGNANFVPCNDVAHINSRFVYIPFNGDPAFISDVGNAGSVQAENFFDAEELPDLNNSVFVFKNTLYIGGTDSVQLFRNVRTSQIFAKIEGSTIDNGIIGGLLEYNETFLFVGRERGQSAGIYAIGSGTAPKLSNAAIDLILTTYTTTQLSEIITGRLKWRGYDIATFTLPDDSFGFYGGNWFVLDTVINDTSRPWQAGFITEFEDEYFTAFSSKIGKFTKINKDYGNPITRIIDTGFESEDDGEFACQSLELGLSQGFNTVDGSVALFMSRDNVLYSDPLYRNLGDLGEYARHLEWNYPGGLGTYNGFMGVRFYTRGDLDFSADHLTAQFR